MKKNHLWIMAALVLLLSVSLLTACGSPAAQEEAEEQKLAAAVEADVLPEIEENVPEAPAEGYAELTLEALLGEDYVRDHHHADGEPHGQNAGCPLFSH